MDFPDKPSEIVELEERLTPFGFVAVYFSEAQRQYAPLTKLEVQKLPLLWLTDSSAGYAPGWRLIETVRPPTTYRSIIEYDQLIAKEGIETAMAQRSTFMKDIKTGSMERIAVEPYQNDPFLSLIEQHSPHYVPSIGYLPLPGSRGMYIPQNIKERIIPALAAKMGIPKEKVRLPYAQEFLQCLQRGMPLEWWPSFYVSEWLQDSTSGADRDVKNYHWHAIFHSIFHALNSDHHHKHYHHHKHHH